MDKRKPNQKASQTDNQIEQFREHVVIKELEAREAKALWEKYYYTIEASSLKQEYNEVMKKEFELQMQQREDLRKLQEDAKANSELLNQEDALPQQEQE